MPDTIEQLPKGAVPQPPDPRDFSAAFVMGALLVDWSEYFKLPTPPNSDQGQALRCVGEATSYYHWQLRQEQFSPKDVYSQIYLPQGGAYLRDGPRIVTTVGQQTLAECADPIPNTEAANRIRCADPGRALDGLEAGYFSVNGKDIDTVAACIRDNKGCIIGVQGDNAGWQDLANPKPPVNAEWGHALYCFGFHMHDGQKCIIAKSSWCNTGVLEHHIKQDYFQSGNTFDGWTLIPKEQIPMYNRYVVFHKPSGREGVLVIGQTGFSDAILWADSQAHFAELKALCQVPADAPVVTLP